MVDDYKIGTAKDTSCIFWQIDSLKRVRTGKLIRYANGHRYKGNGGTNWAHSKLKLEGFNLSQVVFGAHLINKGPKQINVIL